MSHPSDAKNIFSVSDCPSDEQLQLYAQNKLNANEKHVLEQHLVDCELCSDRIEGFRIAGSTEIFEADVHEINRRVAERITNKDAKVISILRNKYFSIAASLLLLIGVGFLFNYFSGKTQEDRVAILDEPKTTSEESNQLPIAQDHVIEKNVITEPPSTVTPSQNKPLHEFKINKKQEVKAEDQSLLLDKIAESKEKADLEVIAGNSEAGSTAPVAEEIAANEINQSDRAKIRSVALSKDEVTSTMQAAPSMAHAESNAMNKSASGKGKANPGTKNSSELENAKTAFKNANYPTAKTILTQLTKEDPANVEALFLLAKSERLLNEFNKSNKHFDSLLQQKNSSFYEEAEWLKALNLKDLQKHKEALKLFKKIAESKGKYAYPAAEMQAEMKE